MEVTEPVRWEETPPLTGHCLLLHQIKELVVIDLGLFAGEWGCGGRSKEDLSLASFLCVCVCVLEGFL